MSTFTAFDMAAQRPVYSTQPLSSHAGGWQSPPRQARAQKARRAGKAGSRRVATMTEEQHDRKRHNDREAQRAIRLRTKNTIEQLTADLKQSRDHSTSLVSEVDRLRAELAQLRTRLVRYEPDLASTLDQQHATDSTLDNLGIRSLTLAETNNLYASPLTQTVPNASLPAEPQQAHMTRGRQPPLSWPSSDAYSSSSRSGGTTSPTSRLGSSGYPGWGPMDVNRAATSLDNQQYAQHGVTYAPLQSSQQSGHPSAYQPLPSFGRDTALVRESLRLQPIQYQTQSNSSTTTHYAPPYEQQGYMRSGPALSRPNVQMQPHHVPGSSVGRTDLQPVLPHQHQHQHYPQQLYYQS